MSKPTEKQVKVIDECITQLKYWRNTNDISSPTHYSDIDEGLFILEEENVITGNTSEDITEYLVDLLNIIKTIS